MIRVQQVKWEGGESVAVASFSVTPKDALNLFLMAELVRGGNVIELEKASVTVSTKYRELVNKYTFTGTYDGMRNLYDYAAIWAKASKEYRNEAIERVILAEKTLVHEDEVRETPFVALLVPSTIGGIRLRIAAMLSANITEKKDIETGLTAPLDELFVAIKRAKEGMDPFPTLASLPR